MQGIENGSSSLLDANGELHAYYHTDYLTSAVNSKAISSSYVVTRDGKLAVLDNRCLFAVKHTNTEVQANIHAFDSALSATEIGIVAVGKNVPTT